MEWSGQLQMQDSVQSLISCGQGQVDQSELLCHNMHIVGMTKGKYDTIAPLSSGKFGPPLKPEGFLCHQ
jgi:hypothetical protein